MVSGTITFVLHCWEVTLELAPSLLLGLLVAGLLHRWVPEGRIRRHLGGRGWRPVLLAAAMGVPLPLCSCGVIPAALLLRRQGAGTGAVLAFLISTPQTGVDALLVTAGFLGWPFALFKWAAALVTGVLGGLLVEWFRGRSEEDRREREGALPQAPERQGVLRYAFFDLLGSLDRWILLGVLLSALIGTVIPAGSLAEVPWIQGWGGLGLVLLISLPLYVCSTGSVPIAAALLGAGMPSGASLVFLMAGPATNTATVGAIGSLLGRRALVIYLATVATASMLLGAFWGGILPTGGGLAMRHVHGSSSLWRILAATVLVASLLFLRVNAALSWWRRRVSARDESQFCAMMLQGVRCQRCQQKVGEILQRHGRNLLTCDLETGWITCSGGTPPDQVLREDLRKAGYDPVAVGPEEPPRT